MLDALRADLRANQPNPLTTTVLFVYRYGSRVDRMIEKRPAPRGEEDRLHA